MNKEVMIDLETMGTSPLAPILQLSAVVWNPKEGTIEGTFNAFVSLQDELSLGFKPEANTILWWLSQEVAARHALAEGQRKAIPTKDALQQFRDWYVKENLGDLKVWANGPSFDLTILELHFHKFKQLTPWKFWNQRCYRTLMEERDFNPKEVPFKGVKHNGLHDCYHQIKCVQKAKGLPWKPTAVDL
jgi:hypothetical protein